MEKGYLDTSESFDDFLEQEGLLAPAQEWAIKEIDATKKLNLRLCS